MAVKIDLEAKTVVLSVGDLVGEPPGNPGRVAGLSLSSRMALGREAHLGHQRRQAGLHEGYGRELFVRYTTTVEGFVVTVQGRIDGVRVARDAGPWVVEEIKSAILPAATFSALDAGSYPHYVEQLRLYCFLLERARNVTVTGRLVLINFADGAEKVFEVAGPFEDCERLIVERARALLGQAYERQRLRQRRLELAAGLGFPHPQPRKHQEDMIAAVEHALARGRHLLVSAPSGSGKTAAALYPAVKFALANDMRVFFVTAKNTQQQIALQTLRRMSAAGEAARDQHRAPATTGATGPTAVAFRAREKMCVHDLYACRQEFCPYLRDFRAKLHASRVLDRLLEQRLLTPEAMIEAGRQTGLCPFELALLAAERTDVIICDYNYVFDPQVYLRRFFQDGDCSKLILIIDEAHNLLERAMQYYSPALSRRQLRALRENLRHLEPALARDLAALLRRIEEFFRHTARPVGEEYSQLPDHDRAGGEKFLIESPRAFFEELKPAFHKLAMRYLLEKTTTGHLIPDDPVEEFFSAFGQFCAVLAIEGEEFSYIFDTTDGQWLKILCKDPSRQLARRMETFHSVIAMSATLEPLPFYRQMLGFDPARTDTASLPSPLPRENRRILVVPTVSTTYGKRAASYDKIAGIIATTAGARPGNYMALFPSYEFLQAVAGRLAAGPWTLLVQQPTMTEPQRQQLLGALRSPDPPKLLLAVQGGLFAEGVDYPGESLSGLIVVSPALPQVSFERELMRQYYQAQYGKGFEFAYLYPGMNRVIQSVGRLIRTESDRGVAVLVCQRFATPQYSTLFPPDWSEQGGKGLICRDLQAELRQFWQAGSS